MLESIEKLREFVADINDSELNSQIVWLHNDDGSEEVFVRPDFISGWHRAVDKTIDNLEAEISERYMELPVDADGVPIHIGDELCGYGLPDGGAIVKALNGSMVIVGRLKGGENYAKSGLLWSANETRHYKQRTIEDVLLDLVMKTTDINAHALDDEIPDRLDALIGEYADKVREAVGE